MHPERSRPDPDAMHITAADATLAEPLASGRIPDVRLTDEEPDAALQLFVAIRDYQRKLREYSTR